MTDLNRCNTYWGNHGCFKVKDHVGLHLCICCKSETDPDHRQRHIDATPNQRGVDGCAGYWPWYGRDEMSGEGAALPFYVEDGLHFRYLPGEFARMEAKT